MGLKCKQNKNTLALVWTGISIITLCPGKMCTEQCLLQTCSESH